MADQRPRGVMNMDPHEDLCVDQYPDWMWEQLEKFQDLKFGLFVHWGIYSQWGCVESWPLVADAPWGRPDDLPAWVERGKDLERFRRDYFKLNETFNPTRFDAASWADAAKYAGMKYLCFTTKHHDGFCMFDTRTTDYRVTHPSCPFHRDPRANITKVVFDTFRERDFIINCYFSKSDWHSPFYWRPELPKPDRHVNYNPRQHPDWWAQFADFVHRQIEELMSGYGPINALWLDGGQVRPPNQDIDMDKIAAMARTHQPRLLMVDRHVAGPNYNFLTPEQKVPPAPLKHPWESCITMATKWSYHPNDTYKTTRALIHMLVDIVSKGGNFGLNVGAMPDGLFPPPALERLRQIGDWMAVNGEAIYGTRAIAPYREGDVCFTKKGGRDGGHVYAIVLAGAEEGAGADRPPATVRLTRLRPAAGSRVELLGVAGEVKWKTADGGVEIALPQDRLPCQHAWTLKFTPEAG